MKQLLFLLILSAGISNASAQNADCTVLMDSIKGTYTGDCKNGKANGNGKSVGIHTYDGEFKNGLPEGKGKYTWANGDYYYGGWKKGMKDGKGQLHKFEDGKETLVTGYWKKDSYKGEYENPYVVANVSNDIGRVEINKMSSGENSLTITVSDLKNDVFRNGSEGGKTTTVMTANQVIRGSFVSKSNNILGSKEVTTFRGIIFPFRAIFNFGTTTMIEVEFFESGSWDVVIPVNK